MLEQYQETDIIVFSMCGFNSKEPQSVSDSNASRTFRRAVASSPRVKFAAADVDRGIPFLYWYNKMFFWMYSENCTLLPQAPNPNLVKTPKKALILENHERPDQHGNCPGALHHENPNPMLVTSSARQ
jgi:hypothetical protein